jgi:hypothetical protein
MTFEETIQKDWFVRYGRNIEGVTFKWAGSTLLVYFREDLIGYAAWRDYKNSNGLDIIDIEMTYAKRELIRTIRLFLLQTLSARIGNCCIVIENRIY